MEIFDKAVELQAALALNKGHQQAKFKIGFVPTMGALHQGHISLIERAKQECDIVVCSIFVNPTQFNDPKDLENYPRTLESDSAKLSEAGCDFLYAPHVSDVYPEGTPELLNASFGEMESYMEGKFRPGHFKGMATVVNRLFERVAADVAYFGEKDFQQMSIVKAMVEQLNLPISIIGCPTIREKDGLAMSSRNIHLSDDERQEALLLSKALFKAQQDAKLLEVNETVANAIKLLNSGEILQLEYFEIVNAKNLRSIHNWSDAAEIRACVAARVGKTRLIDNIAIQPFND